jgi:chemotaxis-related protein WspB
VPVIDLCRASGLPSGEDHFDTRIIVADYVTPAGAHHALGLRAERVMGVQEVGDELLRDSGVQAAPFLGAVASDAQGMLQVVELAQLLPADLCALLFQSVDSPT